MRRLGCSETFLQYVCYVSTQGANYNVRTYNNIYIYIYIYIHIRNYVLYCNHCPLVWLSFKSDDFNVCVEWDSRPVWWDICILLSFVTHAHCTAFKQLTYVSALIHLFVCHAQCGEGGHVCV